MKYIAIILVSIFCTVSNASTEEQAIQKAGEAVVKELGIDKKVKQLEKQYVPEFIKKYGGIAIAIVKIHEDQYIRFEWEF